MTQVMFKIVPPLSKTKEAIDCFCKRQLPSTAYTYRIFLNKFFKTLNKDLEQITHIDIFNYRASFADKAPTYINWAVVVLKNFFSFCKNLSYIEIDPAVELKKIRNAQSKPVEIIDFRSRENLIKVIADDTLQGLRDKAIMYFLNEGLRVSEICNLTMEDLQHSYHGKPAIRILGKGGRYRFISLPDNGIRALDKYIKVRYEMASDDDLVSLSDKVFVTITKRGNGQKITPILISHMLKKYCNKLNIFPTISPHKLRHCTASYLLNVKRWPLTKVRDYLGHANIITTNGYLHSNPDNEEFQTNIPKYKH